MIDRETDLLININNRFHSIEQRLAAIESLKATPVTAVPEHQQLRQALQAAIGMLLANESQSSVLLTIRELAPDFYQEVTATTKAKGRVWFMGFDMGVDPMEPRA